MLFNNMSEQFRLLMKSNFSPMQHYGRYNLARSYLYANQLMDAHTAINLAQQFDYPSRIYNASALLGIITLRQSDFC